MSLKATFVTIGQSPRPDITPGLLARIDGEIEVTELGALDGLSEAEIAAIRQVLRGLSIAPCIPGRSNRKRPALYDTDLYKQSNRIEQMFGRLKDRRSIVTR